MDLFFSASNEEIFKLICSLLQMRIDEINKLNRRFRDCNRFVITYIRPLSGQTIKVSMTRRRPGRRKPWVKIVFYKNFVQSVFIHGKRSSKSTPLYSYSHHWKIWIQVEKFSNKLLLSICPLIIPSQKFPFLKLYNSVIKDEFFIIPFEHRFMLERFI